MPTHWGLQYFCFAISHPRVACAGLISGLLSSSGPGIFSGFWCGFALGVLPLAPARTRSTTGCWSWWSSTVTLVSVLDKVGSRVLRSGRPFAALCLPCLCWRR